LNYSSLCLGASCAFLLSISASFAQDQEPQKTQRALGLSVAASLEPSKSIGSDYSKVNLATCDCTAIKVPDRKAKISNPGMIILSEW